MGLHCQQWITFPALHINISEVVKYISMNNRTCLHVRSAARRELSMPWMVPPCQWTGGDCGYNGLWVMFLLNGSAVALRRLSADTMTRQSSWHPDRQTHTYTGTYIPPSRWQALPNHHWATLVYVGKRMENTHIIVFERLCCHPVCQSGLCNSSLFYR